MHGDLCRGSGRGHEVRRGDDGHGGLVENPDFKSRKAPAPYRLGARTVEHLHGGMGECGTVTSRVGDFAEPSRTILIVAGSGMAVAGSRNEV